MADTKVNLSGVILDNPIIPASGTFGYGYEFAELYDINCLGSLSFKGTTGNERFGNPTPRIAECPECVLNSIGLQNPGVDNVINHELPKLKKVFKKPIIANISGFSADEYISSCQRFDKEDQVSILEVNISCPNVHGGGMAFGTDPKSAAEITKKVKQVTKKPVFMKLTPNVTDIAAIAAACEDAGADGISLINTPLGMRIDIKKRRPILKNTTGGLSGHAVLPMAIAAVYKVYEAVKIPIMGIGGVSNAEEAIEMMLAGATAVQVGAANLVDPYACKKIVEDLPRVMNDLRIDSLSEITGGAHRE